jgi:MoxR-like ATPase
LTEPATPTSPPADDAEDRPGARERTPPFPVPGTVDETVALLARADYIADRALGTSLFLALSLGRPLFLEGEAGVGKTEVAKVLAQLLGRRLIRLQCYEGLDLSSAVYEWNYARQMLEIRLAEAAGKTADRETLAKNVFSEAFLIKRPLLQALEPDPSGRPPVLLIDELDRTDEPFEAFLLEVLSDFQVSIPEIGTVRSAAPPFVVITSNRTREIHDALKRRCLYHWIDYPTAERELDILRIKVPDAQDALTQQIVDFVQRLRARDLFKLPGVAESVDWTHALLALDKVSLDPATVDATLGVLLKYQDDIQKMRGEETRAILEEVGAVRGDEVAGSGSGVSSASSRRSG